MKRAVATDSRGHRWRMAMHVTPGGVVFSLPSQCLLHAAHPLAIASLGAWICVYGNKDID